MKEDDIVKKINAMSATQIEDEMSALELELELDDMMKINTTALGYLENKDLCAMLRIPYSEADKHFDKLQLFAYYEKIEGR